MMTVSVIVSTLDRAEYLQKLLLELEKQDYPLFEMVVVNGPSTDNTEAVLQLFSDRIKIQRCSESNLSKSRNYGIRAASGDICIFLDDDALPCDQGWIRRFAEAFAESDTSRLGAVGGPVKTADTEHCEFKNGLSSDYGMQIFREEDMKGIVPDGIRWTPRIPGGNCAIPRKVLLEIGGFDEFYTYYLDETDVSLRLVRRGYRVRNLPWNFIRHYRAPSKIRRSGYDLRWDVIARSDTYFALKLGADRLPIRIAKTLYLAPKKHFFREIGRAFMARQIGLGEMLRYYSRWSRGFASGFVHGLAVGRPRDYVSKSIKHEFLDYKKNHKPKPERAGK
jgi:glycogen(starch) synthase